jgi:hypothetical protein
MKLLISFLVTNWVYSELVLLCPPLETFAEKVYATLKIPTHDRWPAIAKSSGADRLASDLEHSFHQVGFNPLGVFDTDVKSLWDKVGDLTAIFSATADSVQQEELKMRDLLYKDLSPIEFSSEHYISL